MKTIRIIFLATLISAVIVTGCYANSDKASFVSRIIWRGDGEGDYIFQEKGKFKGTVIADDGAVEYSDSPGTYEFNSLHPIKGMAATISASFQFTGEVTLEISATGRTADYERVVNGVPLESGEFKSGSSIKWRATLAPGSRLTEVSIIYTNISDVAGSFGNPELSGFMFRKPIYISRNTHDAIRSTNLFLYQLPLVVGESSRTEYCDVNINGVIQSDFQDVRFTLADQETLIPHWREGVAGDDPDRKATFWLKVPELPEEGLLIYLYYGNANTKDLSDGEAVFDFFDDFSEEFINIQKWVDYDFSAGVIEYKTKTEGEIIALNTEGMSADEIMAVFNPISAYDWARVRKATDIPPAIDKEATEKEEEESPNIPEFIGVTLAPNGDIVLEDSQTEGQYISQLIHSPFKTRVIVPSWSQYDIRNTRDATITVDISAKEYGLFKEDCENEKFYYASKEDFTEGDRLRWRARLTLLRGAEGDEAISVGLKEFTMDFRPGTITITSPDGGEKLLIGSKYEIVWTAWDYEPTYKMKIEHSDDGGKTYQTIIEKTDNDGRYTWKVPNETQYMDTSVTSTVIDGSERVKRFLRFIRVSDFLNNDINDVSNAAFSTTLTLDEAEEDLEIGIPELDEELEDIMDKYLGEEEAEDETIAIKGQLLVKIGAGGGFEDGDIIYAFNRKEILKVHAQRICAAKKFGMEANGLRETGTLLDGYLANTKEYKFERTGQNTVNRINLTTGKAEIISDTPNDKGEYMNVRQYIERRTGQKNHIIFGSPGYEYWYGGSENMTDEAVEAVWNIIETKTSYNRADFNEYPLSPRERQKNLVISVDDFTDEEAAALISSGLDSESREVKRIYKVDYNNLPNITEEEKAELLDKKKRRLFSKKKVFKRVDAVRVK